MKKFIYSAILLFAIQIGFAQTQDAKTYVKNLGIKEQLDLVKTNVTEVILAENTASFNKEFDDLVTNYLTNIENLMSENYSAEDLNKMNKSIENKETFEPIKPKDITSFQEKAEKYEQEMGMSIEGVLVKYGDPAKLQAMEE